MGLDISAYRQLTPAYTKVDSYGYPEDWMNYVCISQEALHISEMNFPGRAIGVEPSR